MSFVCPKCGRFGMEWDSRAKALICNYNTCNHVIIVDFCNESRNPDLKEINFALEKDISIINENSEFNIPV
ncbi:MAG: hypothetical protein A2Y07_04525 [Planctomycetes bacterium GWF2_50_10]|nr:MAG: hypothetical protein A2Y07_04525 [Planctomycetes bacterium GWF2_50_10]